jgi:hypothetical protein
LARGRLLRALLEKLLELIAAELAFALHRFARTTLLFGAAHLLRLLRLLRSTNFIR